MTHRHPLDQEDPISWHTRINGNTYRLTEHGQLQKEAPMSRTHIDNAQQERQSNAARAVHEELLALALRRAEQHAKEQEQR